MSSSRLRLAEMARPGLVERGIILAVGEIDLRVHTSSSLAPASASDCTMRWVMMNSVSSLIGWPRPLRALGHQRRRGDAVAPRLVADRERGDAGNEDEVADGERRRIARGRARRRALMLEVHDLEARLRDDADRLDVHVGAGQQQALAARSRSRAGCARPGIRAAHADRAAPPSPSCSTGRCEPDWCGRCRRRAARRRGFRRCARFLLALGQAGVRRALCQHVRRDAVHEVLRHQRRWRTPSGRPSCPARI